MRRLPPEPVSARAVWSERLAAFAVVVALTGVAVTRAGSLPGLSPLAVLATAIVIATAALVLGGLALVEIWRAGSPGTGSAVRGILLALALLGWPAWLAVTAIRLPPINDVSTDLADPPSFSRARTALEARAGHVPPESRSNTRAEQRAAYPDLQPITVDLPAAEAFQLVLRAVRASGWEIVDQTAPAGRTANGRVDAIDRSLVMRFPDDITIRIRPVVGETRIDVRSVSRHGNHDFGVNAARIRRFAEQLARQQTQR